MRVVVPVMFAVMSSLDDDILRFLFAMRMQDDVLAGPVICCERGRLVGDELGRSEMLNVLN